MSLIIDGVPSEVDLVRGGEASIHPTSSYTDLMALADASGLIVGDRYRMTHITRLKTVNYQYQAGVDPLDWDGVVEGPPEIIELTAKSATEFYPDATSVTYHNDKLRWSRNNDLDASGYAQTGFITWRRWSGASEGEYVDTDYDWRVLVSRVGLQANGKYSSPNDFSLGFRDFPAIPLSCRLEFGEEPTLAGSFTFTTGGEGNDTIYDPLGRFISSGILVGHKISTTPATPENNISLSGVSAIGVTADTLTFPTGTISVTETAGITLSAANQYNTGQIYHRTHHAGGKYYYPWFILQKSGYRAKWGEGNDTVCCCENADAIGEWGCCAAGQIEGTISGFSSGPQCYIGRVTGNIDMLRVDQRLTGINGSMTSCNIRSTFVVDGTINGDHVGVDFGGKTEGPGILGSELCFDPGANVPGNWIASANASVTGGEFTFTAASADTIADDATTDYTKVTGRTVWVETYINSIAAASSLTWSLGGATTAAFTTVGLHREALTCTTAAALTATGSGTLAAEYVSVRVQD